MNFARLRQISGRFTLVVYKLVRNVFDVIQFSDEAVTEDVPASATTRMIEEKKQREHLLQLNQILAKQVIEMSKIVAGMIAT